MTTFRSGAVVAQVTVNHLVAGSNPAFGAILRLSNCSGVFCFRHPDLKVYRKSRDVTERPLVLRGRFSFRNGIL